MFAVRPCTVPTASKEVTMFTSTHNLPLSSYYQKFFIFCCLESTDHNRQGRRPGYLNFTKVIFRTMRTTRKQFPINWLTSGRLPFTIQRPKARRSQPMKKNGGLSGGTMWRGFESTNCPTSTKKLTIETG